MAVTLSPYAQEMLDQLPVSLRKPEVARRLIRAKANELERIQTFLQDFRAAALPHNANDAMGTLPIWEAQLGIPVQPAGVTEVDRRTEVVARYRSSSDSSSAWVATATELIGPGWTYRENYPEPYMITITLPGAAGTYQTGRIEEVLRDITPAHIDLVITYGVGFVVGVSIVGEEAV